MFYFLPVLEFWFQGSNSESKAVAKLFICHTVAQLVLYEIHIWKRRLAAAGIDPNVVRISTANLRRVGKLLEIPSFFQKFSGVHPQNSYFTATFSWNQLAPVKFWLGPPLPCVFCFSWEFDNVCPLKRVSKKPQQLFSKRKSPNPTSKLATNFSINWTYLVCFLLLFFSKSLGKWLISFWIERFQLFLKSTN